jgi:hypothetical protein
MSNDVMHTLPMIHRSILCLCVAMLGCGRDDPAPAAKAAPPTAKDGTTAKAPPPGAPVDPHAGHGAAAPMPTQDSPPGGGAYDLELRIDPPPSAGVKSRMVFDLRTPAGARVPELAIAHEKLLHFLFVSRDLAFFAHEHPELQPDGTLMLELVFPPAGEYLAFADFTPKGGTQQIVREPVTVAGEATVAKPLVVDDRSKPKVFGGLEVALGPENIAAGGSGVMLEFVLRRGDEPVKDLRPYLGAMGHCVIISEDTTEFLHSHPQEDVGAKPHVVSFHTVFPKPGKYKVWGQFDVGGQMLIADFVVEVDAAGAADEAVADPHANHPH